MPAISSRACTMPSLSKKPAAHSKSLPGVRIVTAALFVYPAIARRISSGSSVARSSTTSRARPSSTETTRAGVVRPGRTSSIIPVLHVDAAEASFNAQMPLRNVVFDWRSHFDDAIVLHVQRQRASDAAVRTHRIGLRLLLFAPRSVAPHLVFRAEHQRAGRADADAVSAIDTCRIGQRRVELGRNRRIKTAARDRNGERVLRLRTARFDAFVAKNAFCVVAYVQLIVDFDLPLRNGFAVRETFRACAVLLAEPPRVGRRR